VNHIAPVAAKAAGRRMRFADISAGWEPPRRSGGPISTRHILRRSAAISTSHRTRYNQPVARAATRRPDAPAAGSRFAAAVLRRKPLGRLPQARPAPACMQPALTCVRAAAA
jgi:hypothetical protein